MTASASAIDVYMKQKHRLIWQRRNPNKDNIGLSEGEKRQKDIEEIVTRSFDENRV